MPAVWINGGFVAEAEASVNVADAGLLHGAGVFTTMRAAAGRVVRIDQHLARLRRSCAELDVPLAYDDDSLHGASAGLLERNGLADARLRVTVTSGHRARDSHNGEHVRSTCFLTAAALSRYPSELYERGMTVTLNSEQKLNPYDVQAGHKTLNYFSRFAALSEAKRRGAGESLWFNVHHFLQSASVSNVFLVEEIDGRPALVTPPTNEELQEEAIRRSCPYPRSNVLPGVTRAAVIEWAHGTGIAVHRVPIDVNRLLAASEVFLTNSIMGVMPVTRLEQKVVGSDDAPGEMTRAALHVESAELRKL